jgi:hypothetical protein
MAKKSTTKKPVKKSVKSAASTSKTSKATKAVQPAKVATKVKVKKPITFASLNKWNLVMAALHFIQGVAVVILSTNASFPVTTSYLTLDTLASKSGSPVLVSASRHLADINLAYLVAAFFFISAAAHLFIATVYRKTYEADLKRGVNKARWFEYSISASIMMIAIAMLSGVYDVSSLLMIFALDFVMNMMGLVMEVHNQTTKKTSWLSYIIGCIAGIVPWIVFAIYVAGARNYGSGQIPSFVYWIYLSMFIFFSSFAVNMFLQYRKIGKWADYLYGERVYMILSLVAKSLLAWQVFFGALRP